MKKIISIAAFLLLAVAAFAQDGKSIYNKYSDSKDVSAVYISPAMFKLIGRLPDMRMGDASRNFTPIVRSLKGLYIISSESAAVTSSLEADVARLVKRGHYEMFMEAKENGETVRMYTVSAEDIVTSLVLLTSSGTFICLDGNMSMEALMKLVE